MEKVINKTDRKKIDYKKVLVISNNPFSLTNNNGKTISSFFDDYEERKVAQLYFSSQQPESRRFTKFYKISDEQVLKSFLKKSCKCGEVTYREDGKNKIINKEKRINIKDKFKKFNICRLVREFFWLNSDWNNANLNEWLDNFSPEIIFFCAGDSEFAYNITNYICNRYQTKLIIYITDDYILKRKKISPWWWIRRNNIVKKMKEIVAKSDLLITISEEMKKEYLNILRKDSIIAVNMTETLIAKKVNNNKQIILIYAGGFHYNRYKILGLLAKNIEKYNLIKTNNVKLYLKIYSSEKPSEKILKKIDIPQVSKFCGFLNSEELKLELNNADIPVHVESFDKKNIEATKLSISTKISEYLSLGKPILAIGPKEIASMNYLSECAMCINNPNEIYDELNNFINDNQHKERLAEKALKKYNDNHRKEVVSQKFINEILKL